MRFVALAGLLVSVAASAQADLPMPPPPAVDRPPPAAPATDAPAPSAATPPVLAADGQERPKLLVNDLVAQGVAREEAAAFTDAVVTTLEQRSLFQVLSRKDVAAILTAERQRMLTGQCDDDTCAGDIGAALGARYVLTGSLSRFGSTYELNLQVLDTRRGQRIGRATRLAPDLNVLRLQMPYAVADATGSPLPPPPSRVLQYSMLASGSAAIIGGGVLGMMALSEQNLLNEELCPEGPPAGTDGCTGLNLRPITYYQEKDRSIGARKTASLLMLAVGAGLAAAGIYLMPPAEGGPRLALVPSGNGAALVGVFP